MNHEAKSKFDATVINGEMYCWNLFILTVFYINFVFFYRKAQQLKQRLAGKSIPFEKFSVSRCKKYFEKDKHLWLPGLVRSCLPYHTVNSDLIG